MKKEAKERHSLKIIAFIFSIFLWVFVISSEPVELQRKLTLKYVTKDGDVVSNFAPIDVVVKLKGSKAFIKTVLNDGDEFLVNLDKFKTANPKKYKVSINPHDLSLPFGIEVLSIYPQEFRVETDRRVEMEVPIVFQVKNKLPEKRLLQSIELNPKNMIVQGPVEAMSKITQLKNIPVDLAQIKKDEVEMDLLLEEVDRRIRFKNGKPVRVKITTLDLSEKKKSDGAFKKGLNLFKSKKN